MKRMSTALGAGKTKLRGLFVSWWQDVCILSGAGCVITSIRGLAGDLWGLMALGVALMLFGWIMSPAGTG